MQGGWNAYEELWMLFLYSLKSLFLIYLKTVDNFSFRYTYETFMSSKNMGAMATDIRFVF